MVSDRGHDTGGAWVFRLNPCSNGIWSLTVWQVAKEFADMASYKSFLFKKQCKAYKVL